MKPLKVKPIGQRDKRWKNEKLGQGVGSIGAYGCLLVSYTMLLNYFGEKRTPFQVNEEMKNAGGYAGKTKNLWVWAMADKVYGTEYGGSFAWNNSGVLNWLKKGVPVIVKVDGRPIGGLSHYVVAIGEGKICDPWTGKIENFSKYKPLGYHVYTFKGGSMSKELKECLKIHAKLVKEAGELKSTISKQATELTKNRLEIKRLIKQAEEARGLAENSKALKEKWHNLYQQARQNNNSLKIDLANCQRQLTNLKKLKVPANKFLKKLFYFILEWDLAVQRLKQRLNRG